MGMRQQTIGNERVFRGIRLVFSPAILSLPPSRLSVVTFGCPFWGGFCTFQNCIQISANNLV